MESEHEWTRPGRIGRGCELFMHRHANPLRFWRVDGDVISGGSPIKMGPLGRPLNRPPQKDDLQFFGTAYE